MSLPFSLNAAQLAAMLDMPVSTLQRNVTRAPDSLPPFLPKRKGQVWITEVVLAWMGKRMSQPVTFKIEFVPGSSSAAIPPVAELPRRRSLAEDLMSASKGRG